MHMQKKLLEKKVCNKESKCKGLKECKMSHQPGIEPAKVITKPTIPRPSTHGQCNGPLVVDLIISLFYSKVYVQIRTFHNLPIK